MTKMRCGRRAAAIVDGRGNARRETIHGNTDELQAAIQIAAMALGKIGDKKAITIVLERMKDEEQEIKNTVEKALMEYKGKE